MYTLKYQEGGITWEGFVVEGIGVWFQMQAYKSFLRGSGLQLSSATESSSLSVLLLRIRSSPSRGKKASVSLPHLCALNCCGPTAHVLWICWKKPAPFQLCIDRAEEAGRYWVEGATSTPQEGWDKSRLCTVERSLLHEGHSQDSNSHCQSRAAGKQKLWHLCRWRPSGLG